jgi:hypothetical protein
VVGLLAYNRATDCYDGERIGVPSGLFDDCVAELVGGGMPEAEARALLLEEREWSDDIVGVFVLDAGLCLHCRRELFPPQRHFCGVVCEAAFHAKAHSGL